tara:strand:- start:639 stop:1907 length:1269 start_codon:yes stop_codon:yes gene_type:complete
MAVPQRGDFSVSLLGIRRELGDNNYLATTNYSNISLGDMSDGSVETLNTLNPPSVRPDASAPHGVEEWKGYDHDFGDTAANTWAADLTNGTYTNTGALNYQRGWEGTSLGSISAGTSGYQSGAGDGSTFPRYTTATGFTYAHIKGIWWRDHASSHTTPRLYIQFADESVTGGTPNWSSFKITGSEMGAKSSFTGPTSSGNNTYYIDRATNPFDDTVGSVHDIKITGASWTASATAPSLTIAVVSPVAWNSFIVDGVITSTGGASITAHGIVASKTNTNPTIGASGVLQFADTSISQTSFTSSANSGVLAAQTWYVRGYATNSEGTTYTNAVTVNTPRRPLTVKYVFTKFGINTVCTTTQTMTIYNETSNTFNTMVQTGDAIYVNADPTDNDQDFGALAHWFSDGNRKRRWGQTSWTSSQTTC